MREREREGETVVIQIFTCQKILQRDYFLSTNPPIVMSGPSLIVPGNTQKVLQDLAPDPCWESYKAIVKILWNTWVPRPASNTYAFSRSDVLTPRHFRLCQGYFLILQNEREAMPYFLTELPFTLEACLGLKETNVPVSNWSYIQEEAGRTVGREGGGDWSEQLLKPG